MAYTQVCDAATGLPRVDMIRRDADGAFIPAGSASTDWRIYQEWLVDGHAPAPAPGLTPAALTAYASKVCANLLGKGRLFNVAAADAAPVLVFCDGSLAARANLALIAVAGQINPAGPATWIDGDGAATFLTGPQCVHLAVAASAWMTRISSAFAALCGAINATSPAVTTQAQIDAYPWPQD